MSGSKIGRGWIVGIILAAALAIAVIGIGISNTRIASPPVVTPAAVAVPTPAAAPPASAPSAPPAATILECMVPGPAPAVPRGEVATSEDMQIQHGAVQGFVTALEAYRACLQDRIDHPQTGTTEEVKRELVTFSNHAIDREHAMADAFAQQMAIFKARQPASPAAK